jgi:hypothetical protein
MLGRTVAVSNEVLEPVTFVLAYPTVFVISENWKSSCSLDNRVIEEKNIEE